MLDVDTDVDDGDDDDCGGGGGITTGRAPGVGMAPAGGVPRGGTPTETGGGRMTAAGALGAVKLASGIRGAWNSARNAKRTIFNHKRSITSGLTRGIKKALETILLKRLSCTIFEISTKARYHL